MQKISRVSAWLLVLAITVLTLIPPSYRPTTEAPHSVEHLAIFLTTGLAFGVAYSARALALPIGLVLFCGLIEFAQLWVPGRHARFGDFIVDAGASVAGLGLAYIATTRWPWGCLRSSQRASVDTPHLNQMRAAVARDAPAVANTTSRGCANQ